jgi:hypothetical protein
MEVDAMPALQIVSRSEWGARPPRDRSPVTWPEGVDLWVHHTTGPTPPESASQDQEASLVRGFQAFHMGPQRNFSDIGYHYLVAPSGRIYEGRGKNVAGAHSPGKNHQPSVALIGDYSAAAPTEAQHRAVHELAEHLRAGDLRGHRENTQTSCPGDAAMNRIVNGPAPDKDDGLSLKERLIRAGLDARSADQVIRRLQQGHAGTIPNVGDSRLFRRLRDAGFGVHSAREIIRAMRRPFPD